MCEYAVKRLSCFQFGSFLYIGAKKTEVRAMKITKVKIEKFSAPLKEPFRVAFGVIEDADSWTVKIETDEGIYGLCHRRDDGYLLYCDEDVRGCLYRI